MLVYEAIFPNGKKYIGATTKELKRRIVDHYTAHTRVDNKFYRALKKYGFRNVRFRVLGKYKTKEAMFEAEKRFIREYGSRVNGYNTTIGGEGASGIELTDEQRANISTSQKRRFQDPNEINKTRLAMLKWIEENPEKHKEHSRRRAETLRLSHHRDRARRKQMEYLDRDPEARKKHGQRMSELFRNNPDLRAKISRSLGGAPIEVYKDGKLVAEYLSISECARSLNLSIGNVGMVIRGKRSHTHGYVLKRKTAASNDSTV